MTIFKQISKDEFYLRKSSSQFQNLSNVMAARIGGVLRDIMNSNVTESNEQSILKLDANNYINECSNEYPYKLGILIGEADFLTIAFAPQFIKTCTYFWLGGKGEAPVSTSFRKSVVEDTFLDLFVSKVKDKINETLLEFGLEDASVDFIVDKAIALKKDTEILLNHISYNIDEDQARMVLMGTTNIISNMQNNISSQSKCGLVNFTRNVIQHEVVAEMKEIVVPATTVLQLKVGDKFKLNYDNSTKLRISGQESHLFEGILLESETDHEKVIKIQG
ncbi:hypothetical protein VCHA53O466_40294 [Vibrio chagasii]|nr:hypothetical protein VCHA53O466_40294 [Vibrio chagasii]